MQLAIGLKRKCLGLILLNIVEPTSHLQSQLVNASHDPTDGGTTHAHLARECSDARSRVLRSSLETT